VFVKGLAWSAMFMQRKETENIVTEFPEIFQHLSLAA